MNAQSQYLKSDVERLGILISFWFVALAVDGLSQITWGNGLEWNERGYFSENGWQAVFAAFGSMTRFCLFFVLTVFTFSAPPYADRMSFLAVRPIRYRAYFRAKLIFYGRWIALPLLVEEVLAATIATGSLAVIPDVLWNLSANFLLIGLVTATAVSTQKNESRAAGATLGIAALVLGSLGVVFGAYVPWLRKLDPNAWFPGQLEGFNAILYGFLLALGFTTIAESRRRFDWGALKTWLALSGLTLFAGAILPWAPIQIAPRAGTNATIDEAIDSVRIRTSHVSQQTQSNYEHSIGLSWNGQAATLDWPKNWEIHWIRDAARLSNNRETLNLGPRNSQSFAPYGIQEALFQSIAETTGSDTSFHTTKSLDTPDRLHETIWLPETSQLFKRPFQLELRQTGFIYEWRPVAQLSLAKGDASQSHRYSVVNLGNRIRDRSLEFAFKEKWTKSPNAAFRDDNGWSRSRQFAFILWFPEFDAAVELDHSTSHQRAAIAGHSVVRRQGALYRLQNWVEFSESIGATESDLENATILVYERQFVGTFEQDVPPIQVDPQRLLDNLSGSSQPSPETSWTDAEFDQFFQDFPMLDANASEQQIRENLAPLLAAVEKAKSRRDEDSPASRYVASLVAERPELFLDAYPHLNATANFFLRPAIRRGLRESDRDKLFARLGYASGDYYRLLVNRGWADEALPFILKNTENRLASYYAAAALASTESRVAHDRLLEQFAIQPGEDLYKIIASMTDLENSLQPIIDELWSRRLTIYASHEDPVGIGLQLAMRSGNPQALRLAHDLVHQAIGANKINGWWELTELLRDTLDMTELAQADRHDGQKVGSWFLSRPASNYEWDPILKKFTPKP